MSKSIKNQKSILAKLNIAELNPMQQEAQQAIHANAEVVLLSPTGSGKTLGFMLPLIAGLKPEVEEVQAMVIVPTRELAIQIEQVTRDMGSGFKTNAVYGGQSFSKDRLNLAHPPAILIGTPGRLADHLRRETFSTDAIRMLVLDEFDKSLEVGFEAEMEEIIALLPELKKKVLTSATMYASIPAFVGLRKPKVLDFLKEHESQLAIKTIISPEKDKLETLLKALCHLGNEPGIIFCNYKETIDRISNFLSEKKIAHACFHGGMEQADRERALIKFRNGTHQLLLATDLAARGIDVPEIRFIIHYQLPGRSHEFTHRNGRTARMFSDGTAYILKWADESLPEFIPDTELEDLVEAPLPEASKWTTLMVSGGRKDKISKGDLVGLFFKQGQLGKDQLGVIELKQDCAFVAVHTAKVKQLISLIDGTKLKNRKIRVSVV
ncbi:DEAD/DEAH box helicase [Mangrovibacterium marinum]|uniref:Superfamily II DNA/RNA helicase n=1 Tax=Mangrovibacterium marinum TaxID=1639118 RepID=A0A2T5BZ97_9BACT|nr:DEAD/DEAH box helicase [Mangrovibacterium marinum]PTN07587.1 superfamily II DNA/RNA helicase [Mangrovibacterium marinum]